MLNTKKILSVAGILLGLGMGGCGNVNVDPLQLMDNSIPPLNSITAANGTYQSNFLQGTFNSSTPYWVFTSNFATFGQSYTAPAAGVITEIGVSTNSGVSGVSGYFITIAHSGRLSTRLLGIQNPSGIRIGDYVMAGQVISSYFSTGFIGFQVLLDGVPVCPLSYLSTQFRSSLSVFTTQMCQ